MMKLSDRKWKAFQLNDNIFSLYSSINSTDFSKLKKGSNEYYPFVTRTENNNGIAHFVSIQDKQFNESNVLIIGLDTQTVFFQAYKFYTGQNIQILKLNNVNMNKYTALFIKPLLQKQIENLNWGGNGATLGRLSKKKIMLPVDNDENPDYDFMERYIKEKYLSLKTQIKEKQKHEIYDWRELNDVGWNNFKIGDIANVNGGKDLPKYDRKTGNIPFVGSSSQNNGVTDFIDIDYRNIKVANKSIGINRNGSVGYSFYHPYYAYYSGDTRFIKTENNNKYANLFIVNIISNQRDKYAYGYKMGTQRIKKQIVKLPTKNNHPDYDFMEQYMKRKENEVLGRL